MKNFPTEKSSEIRLANFNFKKLVSKKLAEYKSI